MDKFLYTPHWIPEEAEIKPSFSIRAGSVIEREQFEAELDGKYRAGRVFSWQVMEIAVAGVSTLLPGDEGQALIELIRADQSGQTLSPEERAKFKQVIDILAEHWPEYREAAEQEARRASILPTLAFLSFVDGWDNVTDADGVPIAYSRDVLGHIPNDIQRRLKMTEMRGAGMAAYRYQYGEMNVKNSEAPSKSPPRPGNMSSPDGSKVAGSSAATTGKKTRSGRSRAGR